MSGHLCPGNFDPDVWFLSPVRGPGSVWGAAVLLSRWWHYAWAFHDGTSSNYPKRKKKSFMYMCLSDPACQADRTYRLVPRVLYLGYISYNFIASLAPRGTSIPPAARVAIPINPGVLVTGRPGDSYQCQLHIGCGLKTGAASYSS